MKRFFIAVLGVLVVCSLCACSVQDAGTSAAYTVNKQGTDYVVDPDNATISDGTHTYQYELSINDRGYTINISYPDGSAYWWNAEKSSSVTTGYGGWSDDYDADRYVDGQILCDILEEGIPDKKGSGNMVFIVLLLVVGVFNTVWPHAAWYMEYGWRCKNAEPSGLALGLNRFGGIIAIIAAIIATFT